MANNRMPRPAGTDAGQMTTGTYNPAISCIVPPSPRGPRFGSGYLERLYPLPRPMRSIDDFYRERHADLATMTTDELARDGRQVRFRLDYDHDDGVRQWLTLRLAAIQDEWATRRRSDRPVNDRALSHGRTVIADAPQSIALPSGARFTSGARRVR